MFLRYGDERNYMANWSPDEEVFLKKFPLSAVVDAYVIVMLRMVTGQLADTPTRGL